MDKVLISELQDHFDCRGKLKKVAIALKCYSKEASLFFSYVDGFGKKQYINIPIEPTDILPILEKYIENIDKDILEIASIEKTIKIDILGQTELCGYISDYRKLYPNTYTNLDVIKSVLLKGLQSRMKSGDVSRDYSVKVCSDWDDKVYTFLLDGERNGITYFKFDGIFKL